MAGFNFGTGSSREQAATCLKHFGAPVVVVGSLNETYKRNALNNGLIALECAPLVRQLQAEARRANAPSASTVRLDGSLRIDFERGVIEHAGQTHRFAVPGEVFQRLIASDGIENQIAEVVGQRKQKQ